MPLRIERIPLHGTRGGPSTCRGAATRLHLLHGEMSELRCVPENALISGWDFSTGGVKCLAFNLDGDVVAEVRLPTDLWTEGGVSELNLMQLEGQARASVRELTAELSPAGQLQDWIAGGISATHHTAGRIDPHGNQVRRAICWNDQTLARYHAEGLERLGGMDRALELTGGPWAIRYTLTHLIKDEVELSPGRWRKTARILPHASLAVGYLTGRFDACSISSAASTGMMDLRTGEFRRELLDCLEYESYRELAWAQMPSIIADMNEPLGALSESLALEAGMDLGRRPLIFPPSDDQAAGLVGGGATEPGHVALILGNSAVVNSSSDRLPTSGTLDAMRLNWGPYLWMRCYNNGALFLNSVIGPNPDWDELEEQGRRVPPGCEGFRVMPFVLTEPSLGVHSPRLEWYPHEPEDVGIRYRACLEALAYLMTLAVREHADAGQTIERLSVSGGVARSDLMCQILASTLERPLKRLQSNEGPALGAAVTALAAVETHRRREQGISEPFGVADAVRVLVRFQDDVAPVGEWIDAYRHGIGDFQARLGRRGE